VKARIDQALAPHLEQFERLTQIPGVDCIGAATIIAELGIDMSVFPTARHAAAWAGVSPGNNRSAGKRAGNAKAAGTNYLVNWTWPPPR